jgi:hypothetical protein
MSLNATNKIELRIYIFKLQNNMDAQHFVTYRENRASAGASASELAIYDNYIASNYSKLDVFPLITLRNEKSKTAPESDLAILDSYILASLSVDPPYMEEVTINTLGSSMKVLCDLNHDSIITLKNRIASQTGKNPNLMRILKNGKYLEDARSLRSLHITKTTTLGLIYRLQCDGGDCCEQQYLMYAQHMTSMKMKPFSDLSADEIRKMLLVLSEPKAQVFPVQKNSVNETPQTMTQNLCKVLSLCSFSETAVSEIEKQQQSEIEELYN